MDVTMIGVSGSGVIFKMTFRRMPKNARHHSTVPMCGLVAQKVVAEGLARAGVCICPVAPNKMLSLDWGFLRNTASMTNPSAGDEPFEMTEALFH